MMIIQINIYKALRIIPGIHKVLYKYHIKYTFKNIFTGKYNHLLTQESPHVWICHFMQLLGRLCSSEKFNSNVCKSTCVGKSLVSYYNKLTQHFFMKNEWRTSCILSTVQGARTLKMSKI